MGYTYIKGESTGNNYLQHGKGISGGLFVRKFHPVGGGKFGIFGQGDVSYERRTEEFQYATNFKSHSDIVGVSVRPGAYFRPTNRFIVEAYIGNIGYSHGTTKPDNSSDDWKITTKEFDFSLTNNLSLAFKFVL